MSISRHCLTVLFLCFVAILVVAQLFHGLGTQSSYKPLFKSNSVNDKEKPARETKKYKEITYTRLGWFQKDAEQGLQFGRTLAGKDLMEAVLANPRYNASSWDDLELNPDPTRRIVAFLDVETCNELHWPRFGQDFKLSSDLEGGRRNSNGGAIHSNACKYIEKALRSPAMSAPESRLVVMNCGEGIWDGGCNSATRNESIFGKLAIAHRTSHKSQAHTENDFGLPPLPVKPVWLNQTRLDNIRECNDSRRYKFSFVGRTRIPFPEFHKYLKPLHGRNGIYAKFQHDHYEQNKTFFNAWGGKVVNAVPKEKQDNDIYYALLKDSIFAGVPRGDNLYSVRFAEVLSAAAIPVIYADGWVLPYTRDVVDWSNFTVMLPQRNMNQTFEILDAIPAWQRCKMQQQVLWNYHEYVADSKARLRGILKVLDSRLEARQPTHFAPGD